MTVVQNIRNRIISLGGEVRFQSQVTGLTRKDGTLTGLVLDDGEEIPCDKNPLDQTWGYLYEAVVNGKEYPIKSEEALMVMEAITEIKRQNGQF